ncbi:MAG: iron-containing alcohol dehydrogenase [Alphaproteobacteria bacterium]|jgi:alcohol dehydrogenase class IV|nr:iron-containing alcohol dehydrogenase [Alphaproteobacteria bacterium]
MSPTANWSYPTNIRLGAGRIDELIEACYAAGTSRPLMVTDKGLADLPMTQAVLERLRKANFWPSFFSDVDPNPTERNLAAGIEQYRDHHHDGVVAFGGGSAIDLGKLIAFQKEQDEPVWAFEDIGDNWKKAWTRTMGPIVAIPTTAGTGSEVGRAAVLTNSETHAKKVIFHPAMLPKVVICDPELTVSMPPAITAGTGMDAFAHCLEAYCAPAYHPMSHGIALEGMRLVKENLPRVLADGSDLEARAHMMTAAAMGSVAFQKGLGAIHALSHPVGAIYGTHHGTTNAVVMPAVLRFNRPAIEEKIAAAAGYLGIPGGFDGFYDFALALRQTAGIPDRLGDLGVSHDRIDEMSAMAIEDPTAGGNPVPLTLATARSLFEECL